MAQRTTSITQAAALAVALVTIATIPGQLSAAAVAAPTSSPVTAAADPAVISDWNTIAVRTIATENATPVPASPLYFGFVHLAMYNAVVAIEGEYESYSDLGRTYPSAVRSRASSEVAAAAAAYRTLKHYFPASADNLRADYQAYLAEQPKGAGTALGKVVGDAAARDLIRDRRNDGRGAAVSFAQPAAPGVWRPTPPALAPMAVPWLGFVRPLLLDSPTQIPLPGPDPLTSAAYAADVAEVQAYGSAEPSARTPGQTATALFYNANPVAQYQSAMRDAVSDRGLDIVDSARTFAILSSSMADALIVAWRSKFDEGYWRPITAIHEAGNDGNPATTADPTWAPLRATPPYPDYPSGHASVTGATTGTIEALFGTDDLDLSVPSLAAGVAARTYDTTASLDEDALNARIWLGYHFRRAMVDANALGKAVAAVAVGGHFQPVQN